MHKHVNQSLALARQSNITGALNLLHPYIQNGKASPLQRKLYGLCLFRFGDYTKAYGYLKEFPDYEPVAARAQQQFQSYKEQILLCVNQNQWKRAHKAQRRLRNGSVTEKNIEGCLYALQGRTKKARECFVQALLMDRGNKQALAWIEYVTEEPFLDKMKKLFKSMIK